MMAEEMSSKNDAAIVAVPPEEPVVTSGPARADPDTLLFLNRARIAHIVLDAVIFILVILFGLLVRNLAGGWSWSKSAVDVIVVFVLHSVFVFGGVAFAPVSSSSATSSDAKDAVVISSQHKRWNTMGQYVSTFGILLATAKWWIFASWKSNPADACLVFLIPLVILAHAILFMKAARTADPDKITLRWASAKIILSPYFFPHGNRNRFFVALTWIVLVFSKVCTIISPLLIGKVVSNLAAANPDPSAGLIALYCLLNFLPNALSELQDSLYVKVFQAAYAQVAEITFRHVHSLSVEWHLQKKMGNVIRSLDRGMEGADSLMYNAMLFLLPAVFSAIISLIVVAAQLNHPDISAICYLGFGFYCWVTLVGTVWRQSFREDMNEHDNEMHDKTSDSLINFETVKCFTNEEHEVQSYLRSVKQYQKENFKTQASTSLMNVSQSSTIQLAMLGSLLVAAYAVAAKIGFSAGEFVTVQAYVLSIFNPLSYLGVIYNSMMNSVTDLQNLSDLLAAEPDVVDAPNAFVLQARSPTSGVSIEFRDVSFHYPTAGPTRGLKHVSFMVPPGTTTALVGHTGSGKTTISRLLFRFYDAREGCVVIDGHDVKECTQKSVRQLIGVVPQDTVMFNETIEYNIRYGRLDATDEEVRDAARRARVDEFVQKFEQGYQSMCGERGLKLSGGEKQRIAIARCLLKNPPVVLLDEATSALDNKTEREVQDAMACLQGRTTIVIAHRLSTVQRADQILVLKDGEVAERGTHDELLEKKGIYHEMWFAQSAGTVSPTTTTPTTATPVIPSQ